MIFCMAAFCAGVIILHSLGILLPWFYYFFVIALALAFRPKRWAAGLMCFGLGLLYACYSAQNHLDDQLPKSWEGQTVELIGYPCSVPIDRERYQQIEFCAQRMRHDSGDARAGNFRLLLNWSSLNIDWSLYPLVIKAKLKRPHSSVNPFVFSFEKYLFYRRIVATGSIHSVSIKTMRPLSFQHSFWAHITEVRRQIAQELNQSYFELEHIGLIRGLLLGDRGAITKADNAILQQTGTQHLLAISGLHVGMVMLLLFRLLPRNHIALFGVVLSGFIYITLVGFSPSAQRAWIMCTFATWVLSGRLRGRVWWAYWLSMSVVLLLDPLAPLGLGFWYSFIAVATLLVLVSMNYPAKTWTAVLIIQCIIFMALAPMNNALLMPQGLGNILANLMAIPWVSILVLPLILLSFAMSTLGLDLADSGFSLANELLHLLMVFLDAIPLESEISFQLSTWQIVLYALVLIALLMIRVAVIQLFLVLSLLFSMPFLHKPSENVSEVWVLDAGQGLSVLFRHRQDLWVYDLGPEYDRFSNAGNVLIPLIKSQYSQGPITGMIISHGDGDHAGGLPEALERLRPAHLWSGEPERLGLGLGQVEACQEGMMWKQHGMRVEVLFPRKAYQPDSSNNHSCVVRVSIDGRRFLLMGDLEGEGELAMLEDRSIDLSADVLIAGHHGSKNASSYALLKRVRPSWVVFSSGYLNRFNHPNSEVVKRVARFNAKGLNTAETGALHFILDEGIVMKNVRSTSRPYWMQ